MKTEEKKREGGETLFVPYLQGSYLYSAGFQNLVFRYRFTLDEKQQKQIVKIIALSFSLHYRPSNPSFASPSITFFTNIPYPS